MLEIVPYNPIWPAEFETIAAALRSGLGDLALRIDHIGSTSVPGLASKDIIDVQVTVSRFDEALIQAFQRMGYTLYADISSDHQPPGFSGPASEWEKLYFHPPASQRLNHMHVRIQGRLNQRYPILFRDYLRAHPASAAGYAALKIVLASYLSEDRKAYTTIKDPVCDIIMASAEEWARATGWSP
jgi:GrpB-like predicted nucleotidyltransferase (UPF0157 family)